MFHTAVVESDAFLDLPVGAQALYFHIGMHADDDGFVNGPRQVARKLGRPVKDLKLLVEKGFLLDFDGVVVIKHWRMANSLQNDRIKPLRYPQIAKLLYIRQNRSYTLESDAQTQNLFQMRQEGMESKRNPDGIHLDSQRKGTEKKGKEMNIKEVSGSEFGNPAEPERPLTQDTELLKMNGILGKGVVLLSNQEQEDLLDKLGLDGFDYYVEKLAKFILANNANIRNHYATILKWWQEDRGVFDEKN